MLLRPPPMQQEDIKSQSSNQHSDRPPRSSNSKNPKPKQNSLGKNSTANRNLNRSQQKHQQQQPPYQHQQQQQYHYPFANDQNNSNNAQGYQNDNISVNSANSKKSKEKRKKQSTIAMSGNRKGVLDSPNKQQYINNVSQVQSITNHNKMINNDRLGQNGQQQYQIFKMDSDNQPEQQDQKKSIGSHGSRNSLNKKNRKKQNTLGKRNQQSQQQQHKQHNYYNNNNNLYTNTQEKFLTFDTQQQLKSLDINGNNINNQPYHHQQQRQQRQPQKHNPHEQSKVQQLRLDQLSTDAKIAAKEVSTPTSSVKYNQVPKLFHNQQSQQRQRQRHNIIDNNYRHHHHHLQNVKKNKQPQTHQRLQKQSKKQKLFSPFQEISLNRHQKSQQSQNVVVVDDCDDDQPIFVLKQSQEISQTKPTTTNTNTKNIFEKTFNKAVVNNKSQQPQPIPITNNTIHDISTCKQMTNTNKSQRRNKIFDNYQNNSSSIGNSSNILNGSFERSSLNKSKSKLGGLLKESRQKNKSLQKQLSIQKQKQRLEQKQKLIKIQKHQQLRQNQKFKQKQKINQAKQLQPAVASIVGGNALQKNIVTKMKTIQRKSIEDEQPFDFGQSLDNDLNLSCSHRDAESHIKAASKEPSGVKMDSVHFDFEPERKKGISIMSKQKSKQSQPSLVQRPIAQIEGNVQSKKHLDRMLRKYQQNEEFLAKSVLTNSELKSSKSRILSRSKQKLSQNQIPSTGQIRSPKIKTLTSEASPRQIETPIAQLRKQNGNGNDNSSHKYFKNDQNNNKGNKDDSDEQPAWHQLIKDSEPGHKQIFMLKEVQRKQVKRPSQQRQAAKAQVLMKEQQLIRMQKEQQQRLFKQAQKQKQLQQQNQRTQNQQFTLMNKRKQHQQHQQHQQQNFVVVNDDDRQKVQRIKQTKQSTLQQQQSKQKNTKRKVRQQGRKPLHNQHHSQQHQQQQIIPTVLMTKNKKYQMQQSQQIQQMQQIQHQQQQRISYRYSAQTSQYTRNHKPMFQQPKAKSKIKESSLSRERSSILSRDSRDDSASENGSSRSKSQKKPQKKESTIGIRKEHKVRVRQQSPRADQSFYAESANRKQKVQSVQNDVEQFFNNPAVDDPESSKYTVVNDMSTLKMQSVKGGKAEHRKPKLIDFNQEPQADFEPIRSKTDINFYNHGNVSGIVQHSQKSSHRPPSSKPPLSKRSNTSSNGSKSKSKTKETTINIEMGKGKNSKVQNGVFNKNNKPQKKTLLDLAAEKSYQGSAYGDSQCSFDSRESFGSANSRGSRKSSGSRKQSTLPISLSGHADRAVHTMNSFNSRPSLKKIDSASSDVEIFDRNQTVLSRVREDSQKNRSKQKHQPQNKAMQRTVVSKDTYFIDERGRLVKQDLVIRGKQVYGKPTISNNADRDAYERMRRSREHHRSRSKSRDGSQSRLSRKNSHTSSSNNFGSSQYSSTNYMQDSNAEYDQYPSNPAGNIYLQQFIRPVQDPSSKRYQKPTNSGKSRRIQQQFYQNQEDSYAVNRYMRNQDYSDDQEPVIVKTTLNQLFGKKQQKKTAAERTGYNENIGRHHQHHHQQQQQHQQQQVTSMSGSNVSGNRKRSMNRTQKHFYNNR